MKKNLVLMSALLLGSIVLTGCNQEIKKDDDIVTPIKHHLIGFYVDNVLYKTVQAEENKTIEVTIEDPTKDGYSFEGWKYENGEAFDIETTIITSSFNVYAFFSKNSDVDDPHKGESELSVTDTKDASKTYSLVVGWYGKSETSGIDVTLMQHIYKNIINYCYSMEVEESVISNITVRQYGNADTNVASLGELVNADSDVDILLGVGANITTKGLVTTVDRADSITMGETTGRSVALVKESTIGRDLFDFMKSTDGQKIFTMDYHVSYEVKTSFVVNFYVGEKLYTSLNVARGEKINVDSVKDPTGEEKFLYWVDSEGNEFDFNTLVKKDINLYAKFEQTVDPHAGESELNVTDKKDASKTYSLVIGWYGKSATSGIDEALMQHIYKNVLTYIDDESAETLSQISVRQYGDANTKVGPMGELVNADGDVDIFLGAGVNITTSGGVTTVARTDEVTMGSATGRVIGLLKETTLSRKVFDFMSSTEGQKIFTLDYHYSK